MPQIKNMSGLQKKQKNFRKISIIFETFSLELEKKDVQGRMKFSLTQPDDQQLLGYFAWLETQGHINFLNVGL
jgi:hypothetical protein